MTAFITHFWKRLRPSRWAALLSLSLLLGHLPQALAADASQAELQQLAFERDTDGVLLSAIIKLELPAVVEDALAKGLTLAFVAESEIFRERWYWTDRRVASAERTMRLSFQPLTRRWRLVVAPGSGAYSGIGAVLNQSFDTLPEALSVIRRISGWRVADLADLEPGARHRFEFRFRLDVTQLPRPLQIGALGQTEWNLSVAQTVRMLPESLK